ncbi:hypothetical protein CTI12_AA512420 [Artemisia annua]|uniref:Reverse transcriptase domain-containing protein n=1 Tax=Artemisia annua TaxID=35608 RepID=A0A2U1LB08_ARTAN|nr:hypothetical protein CTI12_AA512420 [Artemisia annua]
MKFAVIRSPSPYNVILGRSGIKRLRAIPSTIHSMMKFPTPRGIATLVTRSIIISECRKLEEKFLLEKETEANIYPEEEIENEVGSHFSSKNIIIHGQEPEGTSFLAPQEGCLLLYTAKSRKARVALHPKRVAYCYSRPRAGRHKLPCTPRGLPIVIHGQEPEGTSCLAPQEGCLLLSTAKSRKARVALHPKRVAYCYSRPRARRHKLPYTPRGLPIVVHGQNPEGTSSLTPQEGCLLSSTAKQN